MMLEVGIFVNSRVYFPKSKVLNTMNAIDQLIALSKAISNHLPEACVFVGILWVIHGINVICNRRLNCLGIIPRFLPSLFIGPLFSPLLHAHTNHLFYNSVPLFVMLAFLFSFGTIKAVSICLSIALMQGILTWTFGRKACHIGSSGLVMGLMGYFLYMGYNDQSLANILVAILLIYYFGTLLFSIFPDDMSVSFEGHAFGFLSGMCVAHFGYPAGIETVARTLINLFY